MPHPGMSYNPPASAHHELLLKAHEIEEDREKKANKLAEAKAKIEQAKSTVQDVDQGVALGMTVGLVNSETESENADEDDGITHSKKLPERKTKQQRRKAAKLQAEVCSTLNPSICI
jgi:nucleolar protein 53